MDTVVYVTVSKAATGSRGSPADWLVSIARVRRETTPDGRLHSRPIPKCEFTLLDAADSGDEAAGDLAEALSGLVERGIANGYNRRTR